MSVRVFNASDQAGLAQSVADDLGARGFTIAEVANDSSGREVTGVGEVRHGASGKGTARLPGAVPARRRRCARTSAPRSRSTSSWARSS